MDSAAKSFVFGQLCTLDLTNDKYSSGLRAEKRCPSKIFKVHPVLNAFLSRFCARPVSALLPFGAEGHTPVSYYTTHNERCRTQLEYV